MIRLFLVQGIITSVRESSENVVPGAWSSFNENFLWHIHSKSGSPGSSAKLKSENAKTANFALLNFVTGSKSCKVVSKCCEKCHKCLINIFLVSDSLFLQHFWDFLTIYALLSRGFDVEIHALFPQIFCDWKADSANFFAFRMYVWSIPESCVMFRMVMTIKTVLMTLPFMDLVERHCRPIVRSIKIQIFLVLQHNIW